MSRNHDALVARLTEYARLHPRMYLARVAALAVLGYAYLFGVLVLLAALTAGAVWMMTHNLGTWAALKLGIPVVVLAWIIGKSLWVRFTPPQGIELRPAEAPALFAEIERVRTAMQAPRVHRVLIDDDYNAGVNQYPRLGVFGWYRTDLVLGLPYLGSMPLDEYRAVLAHEFGHVSRAHGRFGAWIARVHTTWLRLMGELDRKNHPALSLFSRFFDWYAPYFEAYTAVLRRAQEFEADRMAQAVSPGAAAPALCRGEVASRYLEREFWPGVFNRVRDEMEPPPAVHAQLLDAVRTAHTHQKAREWMDEALAGTTAAWDTHPALRERVAALGLEPVLPGAFTESAAEALLGSRVRPLADRLTHAWRGAVAPSWLNQHRYLQQIRTQLAELEARAEPLSSTDRRERVWLTAELHGDRVALPMARALLGTEHEDASIHYLLGRALAAENDEAALPHLERAVSLDPELTPVAFATAAGLLGLLGRTREARSYADRADEYQQILALAAEERSPHNLRPKDTFLPHVLAPELLARMRAAVALPSVRRAYVVRKRVKHLPQRPLYIVGLVLPAGRLRLASTTRRIVDQVTQGLADFPAECIVMALDASLRHFGPPLRKVAGSEVYRADSLWRRIWRPATA